MSKKKNEPWIPDDLYNRLQVLRGGTKTTTQKKTGQSSGNSSATGGTSSGGGAKTASGSKSATGGNWMPDDLYNRLRNMKSGIKTAQDYKKQAASAGQDVPGLTLPSLDEPAAKPKGFGAQNTAGSFRGGRTGAAGGGRTPELVYGARYDKAKTEYDQVSRELETAGLDHEIARRTFQDKQRAGTLTPADVEAWQAADRRPGELKDRQQKLADQLYELRNQRDAARLQSATSGTLRTQYNTLRAADQELDRLQTELHNWDVSPYTEAQRREMEQRATELDRQVKEQKKLFDDAAKAAGYETTYDGLKEYEARQRRAQSVAQIRQSTRESAGTPGGALALSALTVPGSYAQGVEYLGQLLGNIGRNDPGNLSTYRPLDPNAMPMTNFSQDVQGTVAQNIRGENPTMLNNAAAFLYETGMSIANSGAQVATLGPVLSLASMGGSAAAQRTREVLENGGSNRQALAAGAASGVFEALFEKFSVDNLVKTKSVTGWKSWVKETAKQAGIEASEEMFTEIANICADAAIMGDSSDFARNVEQYRFQGLSEEEAKQQAFLDAVGQVAMAGLGGAISGGVMGGVTNAWQGSQNNSLIQNAGRGKLPDAETVSRLADSEAGQEVLEQMDRQYEMYRRRQAAREQYQATEPGTKGGQNETASQGETESESGTGLIPVSDDMSRQLSTGKNNIVAQTASDIVSFVRNALQKKGGSERLYMGTLPDSAAAFVKDSTGVDVTGYNAILPGSSVQHIFSKHGNNTTESPRGQRAVTAEDVALVPRVLANPDSVVLMDETDTLGRSVLMFTKQIGDIYVTAQAVTDGRHALTTNTLWVQKKRAPLDTIPNAGVTASPVDNARSAPPSEPSLQDASGTVKTGVTVQDGVTGWPEASGVGGSINQVLNMEQSSPQLTPETPVGSVASADNSIPQPAGEVNTQKAAQEPTAQPVAQGPEVQAAPAAQEPTVQERRTVRTEGRETAAPGVRDLREQDGVRLESLLGDEDVDFLDRLGKAAGVTINIVGTNERANGWYQDGQVYIAENAEDPVRQVAKHEITHYLRDMATEDYSRYEALVRETLQAEGSLDSQMETYRRRYQEATGRQYTDAEVMEELAADFTERLLIDENAINRLASQDQSLGQRILAAIRRFLDRVRNALTGRQTTQLEQAARMWESALGQAGTNARAGAQTVQSDEARYSFVRGTVNQQETDRGIRETAKMGSVADVSSDTISMDRQNLRQQVEDFFDSVGGEAENPQLGTVYLNKRGVHSDLGHGVGRAKAASFAAVPAVIENGRVVDYQENWKQRGYDTAVVAAPITIDGEPYMAGVVLRRSNGENRFYVHEVITENEASPFNQGQSVQTGFSGGNTSSVNSILQHILEVKHGNEKNITQDIRSSYGDEPQTTFLRDASMDSVAQPGEDVNTDELKGLELPRLEGADQTTQTENPDVRHSLRGVKSEAEQIEELRKQNQRLEDAQAGTANVPDMTDQEAKTEARRLLMEYGSMADSEETAGLLQGLYNYMREAGAKPNDSTVREVAKTIAQNILDSASETDDAMWRDYEGLRKFLKDTKIKVPRDTWGGLDAVGGYNEFRKQYFGRLNLSSTEGRGIDDVYQELSFDYPGLFDQDAHPNPDDQILQIAETLDAIRPESFNPYAGDRAGAADYLAGEILERYYDRRTDRQVSEAVKKERQRGMDRQKKRLKQVRDQRDEKIKAIKEKNRQAARKAREKQTTAQVRDRVCRHAKGLSRRLLNPRDDFRIPEKLRGYTLALLDDLDLGSGFGYEFTTEGKFKRAALVDENGKPVGANVERTGRTEAALQLKKALEELGKDESLDVSVDPDLADKLNEIAEMKGIPVGGMTRAQAETTWEVIRALESVISNADKTLGQSKYKKLSDMANAMWDAVGDRKDRRNFAVRPLAAADKLVNLDMMTPETFLHRLGKPGDEIHRQMRAAQDKQITITNEGVEQFQAALKESGLTAKDLQKAERENHTFTTAGGQDITLTTAQLMDLYALSHRKQAMDHIYTGGLRTQGGKAGLYETVKAAPVHVTLMDVANMLHELTPAQKGFVDRLQAYMSTTLAAHGNEATMEVYGYEKFKEQNYWPIKVNRNETKTDPAQEARSKTIPGYGMTKALTPNANNSVMLRSAVDTYAEHLNQMSTYAGWLAASENITKLHNFTFFEDGQRTGTIKELFDRVYGTKGNAYLDDLLSDVAQGTKTGAESTFSDSLLNKFKAAKVGANLRVIFQQPTAILRAAEVIDPKYMATVKNPLKGFERAKKWSPIALWKDWGYFEMDTGRSLRELMVGTEGALDKLKNVAMGGAGLADNVAWGHLWNAVEAETRAEHKELRAGSDAFYQQCARRFGEIIDRTQVVDSVLHRTQIMRSSNFANRLATSFMSEPSKIYNMAARDFYDIIHAEKGSQEQKRAVKHVVRTGAALIASFAVNAIAQSAPDWWRDDDRDKEFVRTFQDKWVKNFTENFDPVGYIPYLKDIESIIQGYDVERSDMEGIADLWSAAETMMKAASGTGKKSVINAGLELAMKGLDLMGLPAGNIKRDVVGILNTVLWGTGEWETVYEMDKLMLDVGNANNANVFYDTLYRAMDGDWMEYQRIYGDMLESGFDPDKINTAMNKRMAQDAGLTKAKHLPMEWAPPGEDPEFDAMVQVEGSWLDQTDEEALELARTLDSAELEGETDSEKNRSAMRMIADQPFGEDVKEMSMEGVMSESAYAKYMAARAAGVSTYDYVDFLEAAREANLARGKSGSSFSQDDVTKALEGSGLTSAQKRAIWDTYGWKTRSPWG